MNTNNLHIHSFTNENHSIDSVIVWTVLLGPRDAVAEADDEEEGAGEGLLEELAHLL